MKPIVIVTKLAKPAGVTFRTLTLPDGTKITAMERSVHERAVAQANAALRIQGEYDTE